MPERVSPMVEDSAYVGQAKSKPHYTLLDEELDRLEGLVQKGFQFLQQLTADSNLADAKRPETAEQKCFSEVYREAPGRIIRCREGFQELFSRLDDLLNG